MNKLRNKLRKYYVKRILKKAARLGATRIPFTLEDISLLLDLTQKYELDLALHKYDHEELEFLIKNYEKGTWFVDIGANIGFYSLYLSKKIPDSQIIAFEPDKVNLERFQQHIVINGMKNITTCDFAIADTNGKRAFRVSPNGRGSNSLIISKSNSHKNDFIIEVPCKTLIDAMSDNGVNKISALKIDIEGYEFPVLKNFFTYAPVELYPKAIVIESWGHIIEKMGGSPIELLISKGYSIINHKRNDNFCMIYNLWK